MILRLLVALAAPLLWAADPSVVSLFPSDDLTVPDAAQATGLRVHLPYGGAFIDQLDGFSVNPRIAVQFSGPVDPATLRSSIFITPADRPFDVIPINRVVYDPSTFTVYAKPNRVLDQQRKYRLIVASQAGVVASTTFTTLSVSTWLQRVHDDLPATPPSLMLDGAYKFADIAAFTVHQQTHANPSAFQDFTLPVSLLGPISGIGSIAFVSFRSPTYLNAAQTIDSIPSGSDPGPGLGSNQLYIHALLPVAAKPSTGYPVVIFGHGLGDTQYGGSSAVAPTLIPAGFAIVAMNAVGHGYGAGSTVILRFKNGRQIEIPAGGRSIPDASGAIQASGGCIIVTGGFSIRDCLRQTAIDLMQLVRTLKSGVDLDGDGAIDLDPNRIYYVGQSLGSLYGTLFTALETDVPVATLNAGGGSVIDIARWSPAFRPLIQQGLALGPNFNDADPLPDRPVAIVSDPAALAVQDTLELVDWANSIGDPLPYAPLLRGKRVLFQFASGDQTVPNPTESALVRAANMRTSTWVFRNDLARAAFPSLPANPHAYLTNILSGSAALAVALATQAQIAGFFMSGGTTIPDPNTPALPYFEIPSVLPETLGFPAP